MAKNKGRERRQDESLSMDKSKERHVKHEEAKQLAHEAAQGEPSDVKVIGNFLCNHVEGKKGSVLTQDQIEMIGPKHMAELEREGCIQLSGDKSEPEIDAEEGLDGEIKDGAGEISDEVELIEDGKE